MHRSHLKLIAGAMEGNIVAQALDLSVRCCSEVGATSPESKKPINDEIAELETPLEEPGWSQERYD